MTSLAPGSYVDVVASAQPNAISSSLGTAFLVGQSGQGPVGQFILVNSLGQYEAVFGNRNDTSVSQTLFDAVDAFFEEGGQSAYISRSFAAASIATDTAKIDLEDSTSANTILVSAIGPGAYGNGISIQITAPSGGTVAATIAAPGQPTEISPAFTTQAALVNWINQVSTLVVASEVGSDSNLPAVVGPVNLTGGADNTAAADADHRAALNVFVPDLGMGQVAVPGVVDAATHENLLNHALANNRFALCDDPVNSSAADCEALAATAAAAATDPSVGYALSGAWPTYPGLPTSTATPPFPRIIAPSGPTAGAFARLASQGANGDQVPAGTNGFLTKATGVTLTYSASDRNALENVGVCVIRDYKGIVQLYGGTTLSLAPGFSDLGNARLRMQIQSAGSDIGDNYVWADIDGQGHLASAFVGDINSYMTQLFNANALFGQTPADAFFVNGGSTVNTPATAAARTLVANVGFRASTTAKWVFINVTSYPVSAPLPA
jgi:hypothetical protein